MPQHKMSAYNQDAFAGSILKSIKPNPSEVSVHTLRRTLKFGEGQNQTQGSLNDISTAKAYVTRLDAQTIAIE